MHNFFTKQRTLLLLILFIFVGILFRYYNLNWGAPFYFHPDERNIASSITQLQFPNQMNPHFFAYGSLPIYLVYFVSVFYNSLFMCHSSPKLCPSTISFEQAILGLRLLAAICSLSLIPLLYLIGKQLRDRPTGITAAFFATTSVGFIQFAHFGTYEMWLTFWSAAMFASCIWYYQSERKTALLLVTITTGILCASKVTSLVLLIIPVLLIGKQAAMHVKKLHGKQEKLMRLIFTLLQLLLFSLAIIYIYILTNPYTFLDNGSFMNSMHYESGVALGTEPVFYTGEFYNTQPVIFQFLHDYPFLLDPLLLLFFIPSFFYVFVRCFKKRKSVYAVLLTFYILLFFSQAFFFVKWVRYFVPTIPFMYLMIAIMADDFLQWTKTVSQNMLRHTCQLYFLFSFCIFIFAFCFFITAYVQPDTRVTAANAATHIFSRNTPIESEVYDLGITAFNPYFSNIKLFNYYDLDNPSDVTNNDTLSQALQDSDGIILPSQRIMKMRLLNAKKFPEGNSFYMKLFKQQLPFRLVYETPCDIFCRIAYVGNPVFSYEETATVFDRPTVYIFKRISNTKKIE